MNIDKTKSLDLRRYWREAKKSWWAFVVGIAAFLALGITYWNVKMPQYNSYALIMVENESGSLLSNALGGMAGMLSLGGNTSASNELFVMNSNEVLINTIKNLKINRTYIENDGLQRTLLFNESPIEVQAPEAFFDTLMSGFRLKVTLRGDIADIDIYKGGRFLKKKIASYDNVKLPHVLATPYGPLNIDTTGFLNPHGKVRHLTVNVVGNLPMATELSKDLNIDMTDKMTDAVTYEFKGPDKKYNEAIINSLISEYFKKSLARKHESATEQVEFYDGRLADLFAQLSQTEKDIEKYKKENNIVAPEAEAELLAKSRVENQAQIALMQAQYTYYQQVLATLERDPEGLAIIGGGANIPSNPLIEEYNKAVLEKRNLETSAKPDNIALKRSVELINQMRRSLVDNAKLMISEAELNLKSFYSLDNATGSLLQKLPEHERKYLTMFRDQTIMSELYAYLLGQRESAAFDRHTQIAPAFVVDAAYSDVKPSLFKGIVVMVLCIVLGLAFPCVFVWLRMRFSDKIKDPCDLAEMDLEQRSVAYDGAAAQMANLRMQLTAVPERRVIYVADFNGDNACADLEASFSRAGIKVKTLVAGELSEFSDDNDSLVNPQFRDIAAREAADGTFVFIPIPDVSRLNELANTVDEDGTQLLVVLKGGTVKRHRLHKLLKNMPVDDISICIVKC